MGLDSAQTETVTEADAMLEGKGEKKETNQMQNSEDSTCCSE